MHPFSEFSNFLPQIRALPIKASVTLPGFFILSTQSVSLAFHLFFNHRVEHDAVPEDVSAAKVQISYLG